MTLREVSEDDFPVFLESTLKAHAVERAEADDVSVEDAEAEARQQHAALLPWGRETPGHRFAWIDVAGASEPVGMLWWHEDEVKRHGFVYWIAVAPSYRRRGIASRALAAVQDRCRQRGCRKLVLNVFGSNRAAIALYRKLGFGVASMHMSKAL